MPENAAHLYQCDRFGMGVGDRGKRRSGMRSGGDVARFLL